VEQDILQTGLNQEHFFDVLKRAYEKGLTEKEITVQKILDDLTSELKNNPVK